MSNTEDEKKIEVQNTKLLRSITIAIIIVIATIPHNNNPYNFDYVTEFCAEGVSTEIISFERLDFFACEIGFIDGEIDLGLYLSKRDNEKESFEKAFEEYTEVDILVLNYQNYNNFIRGEDYGVSNIELLSLNINPENDFMQKSIDSLDLYPDYYFLVFNWEYGEDDGTYNYPELEFYYYIRLSYAD
jgi:hypothetical protein